MTKLNFYQGYYSTVNNFLNYKNPILNYFKDIYNDCFVPSFMNNNNDELNRNKHAGAHISVKSFTPRENGFRDYNSVDYYYVTTSQVNIVNHYYFTLSKSVVNNAKSNNKFMFITPNSLFVCDRDFVIDNSKNEIKYETNVINKECYFVPVENCEMIPFNPAQYFGFYNTTQWKPRSIGFYCGKVAGNEFRVMFNNPMIFSSTSELWRFIQNNPNVIKYNKTSRSLQRDVAKGIIKFIDVQHNKEVDVKVEMICHKCERHTEYETVQKRVIKEYVEEQEKNLKEWEEFQKQVIEELDKAAEAAPHSVKSVTPNNSETQNVSDVIIKSNTIDSRIVEFNNNIGHPASQSDQTVVQDNKIENWNDFVTSKEIWSFLKRRPRIQDFLKYRKGQLSIKEA